jgi:uncharacterized membrane protein YheB (UPF0754 family)
MTNAVAVRMLFRPHSPIRLFIWNFQGVFPKRKKMLARKIARIVSRELFSVEEIKQRIREKASSPETLEDLERHIDRFVREKLPRSLPLRHRVADSRFMRIVRQALLRELKQVMALIIEGFGDQMERHLDLERTVKERIDSFSNQKMEAMLMEIMKTEFRMIEWFGGALGLFIGLVQMLIVKMDGAAWMERLVNIL